MWNHSPTSLVSGPLMLLKLIVGGGGGGAGGGGTDISELFVPACCIKNLQHEDNKGVNRNSVDHGSLCASSVCCCWARLFLPLWKSLLHI